MLLPLQDLAKSHKMYIRGIVQVGCHWAEEYDIYKSMGIRHLIFIEPCKAAYKILSDKFDGIEDETNVYLFNRALADYSGEAIMHIETRNNGQSNSLLAPKDHLKQYPDITFDNTEKVRVSMLDDLDIDYRYFNTLVMDTQGSELLVLKGGVDSLKNIDYIYTEINRAELYEGCALVEQIDSFLSDFDRVETYWAGGTWGDALYIRKQAANG